ncbi:RNA-guided endonuclease InsQ/TnpB family protein [Sodalinema gerasimenkoae]|uniref:RNA-guided endonuclease InsQ/TnpB family protein n=1 Tax=Sodalinema gerasimenkoae TaxID=2862348 RepID=UPI001358E50A|nr:RNA-guided endonuclease TnpB family protein [Sodalinema gerasimenkoae]
MKVVKLRIYPTPEQSVALAKAFGCCRLVWNRSLQLTTEAYRQTGKGISGYDLKKMLPQWKQELEWLGETYSQCLQSSVLNLSRAFVNFFEGRARYPRFKSKHKRQSLQYPQNVKLEGDQLHLPKIGEVYCRVHRWFEGPIKTVTVSRHPDGRYHASIMIDDGSEKPEPSADGKAIGIDLGLKHFAVTSDGEKYNNPRHLKKHERNLKRKQRKLSRKQQGSNSRQKARRLVARVHSKIANSRADFLHKLSRKIVNENQVIVVENLAVKNMVKNHSLAKAISDVGWGIFSAMLKYKAEGEGKVYLEVDRFFPSTHLCSETLLPLPQMGLDVRSFECPQCGKIHDRDLNAAINLKNEGLRIWASGTGASASGGNVRPKRGRIRSMLSEAIPDKTGSPRCTRSGTASGSSR